MQTVEAEGLTIDEAIANALTLLGVDRERVDIEILSDASRGLFGLGGKPARVRATVRSYLWDAGKEVPGERGDEGLRKGEAEIEQADRDRNPAEMTSQVTDTGVSLRDKAVGQRQGPDEQAGREGMLETGESRAVSSQAAERGMEFLRTVLDLMGIEAVVNVEVGTAPYNDVVLQVTGESSGVVIGRHGQTVDAIEYIVNRLVAREYPYEGHIVVDAAEYRMRRRQSLTEMARRLAEKAKRERRTVTLNPLSPRDRRVVHIALRNDRGITTRSHGVGLHRKLLIIPGGQGRRQQGGAPQEH
jgi:spoIIIJ-associated protein